MQFKVTEINFFLLILILFSAMQYKFIKIVEICKAGGLKFHSFFCLFVCLFLRGDCSDAI